MDDVTRVRRMTESQRLRLAKRASREACLRAASWVAALTASAVAIVAVGWVRESGDRGPRGSRLPAAQTAVCATQQVGQTSLCPRLSPAGLPVAQTEVCAAGVGQTSVCPSRSPQDCPTDPTPAERAAKILSDWRRELARTGPDVRPEDWETLRALSLAAFKRLGHETAGPLERAALDPNESLVVRTTALEALVEVDPSRGVEAALVLVQPSQPVSLRTSSIQAMIGPKDARILPALAAVLAEERFDGRYLAAYALGRRREAEAIPLLEQALTSDPSVTVRCHAAAALADLRDPGSWDVLTRALQAEPSETVRERIVAALAISDPDRSVAVLRGIQREDPSAGVRRAASLLLSPSR